MTTPIQLVPVLDLLNGIVVRGVAGQRDQYQANQSCLAKTPDPLFTAQAFQQHFRNEWLYVADLDGILHQRPNYHVLKELVETGVKVCADIGVRSLSDVQQLLALGCTRCVIGLETLPDFTWLKNIVDVCDPMNLTFSLDLKSGVPLHPTLCDSPPIEIAQRVYELGIKHMIVLDLASVGTDSGIPTLELCQTIQASCSQLTLWTGGGVRDESDIQNLEAADIGGVLAASALHDGRIGSRNLREELM